MTLGHDGKLEAIGLRHEDKKAATAPRVGRHDSAHVCGRQGKCGDGELSFGEQGQN